MKNFHYRISRQSVTRVFKQLIGIQRLMKAERDCVQWSRH